MVISQKSIKKFSNFIFKCKQPSVLRCLNYEKVQKMQICLPPSPDYAGPQRAIKISSDSYVNYTKVTDPVAHLFFFLFYSDEPTDEE